MPYELARTHQLLGELASIRGERAEARASLSRARSLLGDLQLPKRLAELETTASTLGLTLE